ncbi:MAG: M23 family metallopeptidase, partial [Anaerolineae bacterium]
VAPDNLDFSALHGIAEREGYLYMLAGANLYGYDLSTGITGTVRLVGQLPVLQPLPQPDPATLRPGDLPPNDPQLPSLLATYNFTMPIKGALLPDRSAIYPGSRRVYRYGVHQGLDFYNKDVGVEVEVGTPVYAAGDGIILRADVDYQEMSLAEVNALLADADVLHVTPPETLEKLGGRQIWIDHGQGVITKYSHLSGIAEGITVRQRVHAGQPIGYIGVSGTPDGIAGNTQFTHLHFEIRTGNDHQYYLGQWLTIEETRRAFERIFNVPVRPAYLDFRENGEGTP